MENSYNPEDLKNYLRLYYKELFPHKLMFKWLSYGGNDKSYFPRREFCFTLEGDVYLRYKCFTDALEMEKEIVGEKDNNSLPFKIDIGAVYNTRPSERSANSFACERELVFDIDLTDYDDIRTCCSGGDICSKCWQFIVVAVKVIDRVLREDFGFKHCLWVFSGRRGVHCWVCDSLARKLTQQARVAVVEYIALITGGEQSKKLSLGSDVLHPSINEAIDIIKPLFKDLIIDQKWLEEDNSALMETISNAPATNKMIDVLKQSPDPDQRWKVFRTHIENNKDKYPNCIKEIMLQFAYPRLDANVSKGINHLLKSPFCVHPKTGKVSIPFDPEKVDRFNPADAPRIDMLCKEVLNLKSDTNADGISGNQRKMLAYKHTTLKEAVTWFESFVQNAIKEETSNTL